MNILRKLFGARSIGSPTPSASTGDIVLPSHYDGAQTNQNRSSFIAFPLTARREITRFNRVEILKKVRAVEANLGLIARMKSTVGKYAVGRGVSPAPQSKDAEWNDENVRLFNDWANNRFVCDAAGAMTFWERQRFHAETFFAEAESFDALVSSSQTGAPQLQLFDSSEIGNAMYGDYSPEYIDGVKINDAGRPLSYLAVTHRGPGYGQQIATPIDAGNMIHIIRRKRANQLRGISPFAPVVNCAIDLMDLRSLTTAAAKLHEALGIVVKKEKGEAGKTGITGDLKKILDGDGKLSQVNENFFQGAGIQYMAMDEQIELLSSNRPSANLMEFLNYLIRDIALGCGLSYEIVWNMAELGGATARIALADAQWFFDGIQDLLNETFNQRVWVWWTATMMNEVTDAKGKVIAPSRLRRCKDPRWWSCHWQGPPKLTADAGRTMTSEIDGLHAALNTWEDFYNQRGANWKSRVQQRINELAWTNAQCAIAGIDPSLIFAPKPGTQIMPFNGVAAE